MMILLAVVQEGLAAGYACFGDNQALRELLGIPEEVEPMGAIPIGYAAPDQVSSSHWRDKSKDNVSSVREVVVFTSLYSKSG